MISKYHNHTLQTNQQYRDGESQNTNSHQILGRQSALSIKKIAQLKRILRTTKENNDQTQNPHNH